MKLPLEPGGGLDSFKNWFRFSAKQMDSLQNQVRTEAGVCITKTLLHMYGEFFN